MGRNYQPDPAASSSAYSAFVAGEDIKAGDIITQAADGAVYWAQDPASPYAQLRPVFQPADAYVQNWGAPVIFPQEAAGDCGVTMQLDDGAYLYAYRTYVTPDGSGGPWSEALFSIYNRDMTVRVFRVYITKQKSSTSIKVLTATKLKNGNIMFVLGGTGSFLSYAIFAQDGSQVVGLTQLDISSVIVGASVALLPNGNVAIGYCLNDSKVKLAILSQTGATIVAPFLVDNMGTGAINSNQSQTQPCQLAVLSDGSMVLANAGGTAQMFTQAGALLGNKILFANNPWNSNSYINVWAMALAGGGFVLACDATVQYMVYSSTGALLKTLSMTKQANTQNSGPFWDFAAAPDGGFYAMSAYVTGSGNSGDPQIYWISAAKFDAAGVMVGAAVNYKLTNAPMGWTNFGWGVRCYVSPDGKVVATTNNVVLIFGASLNVLTERLALNVPAVTVPAAIRVSFKVDTINPNLVSMLMTITPSYTSTGYVAAMLAAYLYAPARVPVGVASTDAVKGSVVSAVIQGPTRTRLMIVKPYSVDATSAAGQKLSLLGNAAILKGAI